MEGAIHCRHRVVLDGVSRFAAPAQTIELSLRLPPPFTVPPGLVPQAASPCERAPNASASEPATRTACASRDLTKARQQNRAYQGGDNDQFRAGRTRRPRTYCHVLRGRRHDGRGRERATATKKRLVTGPATERYRKSSSPKPRKYYQLDEGGGELTCMCYGLEHRRMQSRRVNSRTPRAAGGQRCRVTFGRRSATGSNAERCNQS